MWQLVWAKCCSSWLKVGKNLQQLLPLPSWLIIKRQIVMAAIPGQNTQVLAINNSGSAATSMAINLKVRLYLPTTLSTLAVQHCSPSLLAPCLGYQQHLAAAQSSGDSPTASPYSAPSPQQAGTTDSNRMYNAINSCHFLKYLTGKQTGRKAKAKERAKKGREKKKKHKQHRKAGRT